MEDPVAIGARLRARRETLGLTQTQAWELVKLALPLAEARYRALGADLARMRREKGLTQAQVATDAGLSISTVSRLERGQWGRDNLLVLAYAYAMGIPFEIEIAQGVAPAAAKGGRGGS